MENPSPPIRGITKQTTSESGLGRKRIMGIISGALDSASGGKSADKWTDMIKYIISKGSENSCGSDNGRLRLSSLSDEELKNAIGEASESFFFVISSETGDVVCVSESGIHTLSQSQADFFMANVYDLVQSRDAIRGNNPKTTPITEFRRSRRISQPKLLLTPLEEDTQIVGSLEADSHISRVEKELSNSDDLDKASRDLSNISTQEDELEILKEENTLLTVIRRELEEKMRQSEAKVETLAQENEYFKVQVKNYLSAIQILNSSREKPITTSATGEVDMVPTVVLTQKTMEYEKKLIQVAEMHGELFEFNDRLHKVILQKECLIKRLTEELIELRGPLPQGIEVGELDSISAVSESSTISTIPSYSRPLVNIWIPSAFLSEQGTSSSHHIYQIYIRIKDEEWNVYRRYSQFYDMRRKMAKKYPIIGTFEFPPKTLTKKSSRVVQERRKKLESFLRCVVNTLHMECAISDRRTLVSLVPFLGMSDDRASVTGSRSRSETRTSSGQSVPESSPYLGF